MTDNVTLPGTGTIVAADDVGGKLYQRMKIAHGPDGSATDVSSLSELPVLETNSLELLGTNQDIAIAAQAIQVAVEAPLRVIGRLHTVTVELTRPADTTAYAAGDVVSNSTSASTLLVLSGVVRTADATGYIVRCELVANRKSIVPAWRVHFYNALDPTVSVDNAPHRELYADVAKRIGYVDLPVMATATDVTNSDMSRTVNDTCRLPLVAVGGDDVYALLQTSTAFTPGSGDKYTLVITVDLN